MPFDIVTFVSNDISIINIQKQSKSNVIQMPVSQPLIELGMYSKNATLMIRNKNPFQY